jgi:hypothetical protein
VPLDFLGVNYYQRHVVRANAATGRPEIMRPPGEYTTMGWEVYPDALCDLLLRLSDEYNVPRLVVTENGAAFPDVRTGGRVEDPRRRTYLETHVDALARAVAAGAPVSGYFVWSLLDNFEWALGYSQRFGLVYVDFETQARVPKASFRWYRELIAAQRVLRRGGQTASGTARAKRRPAARLRSQLSAKSAVDGSDAEPGASRRGSKSDPGFRDRTRRVALDLGTTDRDVGPCGVDRAGRGTRRTPQPRRRTV